MLLLWKNEQKSSLANGGGVTKVPLVEKYSQFASERGSISNKSTSLKNHPIRAPGAPADQGGSMNILRRQIINDHLQNSAKLAKKHSFLILNMKQICHWHCQGLK